MDQRRYKDIDHEESPFPPEMSGRARALLWGLGGGLALGIVAYLVVYTAEPESAVKLGIFAFVMGAIGGALVSGVGGLPPKHSTLEAMGKIPPRRYSKAIPLELGDGDIYDLEQLADDQAEERGD